MFSILLKDSPITILSQKQNKKPLKIKDPAKVAAGKARAATAVRIGGKFAPAKPPTPKTKPPTPPPTEGKQKDPAKVAAGKARAAKSIRIDGKFTSNEFLEKITKDAVRRGGKNVDVFQYFLQNEKIYEKEYKRQILSISYYTDESRKFIQDANHVKLNGKAVSKGKALLALSEFKQFTAINLGAVDIKMKHRFGLLSGDVSFEIPPLDDIQYLIDQWNDGELSTEELQEWIYDEYGIYIIVSNPK